MASTLTLGAACFWFRALLLLWLGILVGTRLDCRFNYFDCLTAATAWLPPPPPWMLWSYRLLPFSLLCVQLRIERLEDLRKRVRDEPPAGGKTTRIRLQLPNGSKVRERLPTAVSTLSVRYRLAVAGCSREPCRLLHSS